MSLLRNVDLAKIHEVSLMTRAARALASLEREGIVERRRGIGTFRGPHPKIHFQQVDELHRADGQAAASRPAPKSSWPKSSTTSRKPRPAPCLFLPRSAIIKIERLRSAVDEPFALENLLPLPRRNSPIYSRPRWLAESLFATLERDYKVELGYADEKEIDATRPRTPRNCRPPCPSRGANRCFAFVKSIYSTQGKAVG